MNIDAVISRFQQRRDYAKKAYDDQEHADLALQEARDDLLLAIATAIALNFSETVYIDEWEEH